MNIRESRVKEVQHMIKDSASITIKDLAVELGVSKMTIRRDLDQILEDPEIQLIRGMFIYNRISDSDDESKYSVISASTLNHGPKEKIAEKAKSLLEPGDTIIIDAGSTTEMLARIIPENLKLDVTCFSMNILNEILKYRNCSITFPGGKYHCSSMIFQSREGIELLKKTRVKKAFISAYGVNLRLGVTCSADFERELKLTALNSAEQRILLVDSSKFGKVNNVHFADLEDFDTIVTDNLLPAELAQEIRRRGITLFTV
ncbi:MAG: DeoR/GlpR transcriptional regulator [Spirochaetales bacterium]|nr:DeoR/GlpR transcriptional regulator [Spirochaetales bacterium]